MAAAVPTDVIPTIVQGINDFDISGRLGVTDYPRDTTQPLGGHDADRRTGRHNVCEGAAPTQINAANLQDRDLGRRTLREPDQVLLGIPDESWAFQLWRAFSVRWRSVRFSHRTRLSCRLSWPPCKRNTVATFIQSGTGTTESPADAYSAVMALKYGLPFFWQNSPNLRFLLSPTDLERIKNARTTQNVPLFNEADDTILGKPYVVHPDADRVLLRGFQCGLLSGRGHRCTFRPSLSCTPKRD